MSGTKDMVPAEVNTGLTTTTGIDWGAAIAAAIELGKDGVEVLERLHAIQKDERAANARAAFYLAVSELHARLGSIPKNRTAKFATKSGGKVSYRYADLHAIATALRKHTGALGLAWKWDTTYSENSETVTCIAVHRDGHYETSTWRAPIDGGNPMTSGPQKAKIATTFAQRVTLIQVFGLTDTDDDVDGQMPAESPAKASDAPVGPITPEQAGTLRERLVALERTEFQFLTYFSRAVGCAEDSPIQKIEDIPASHYQDALRATAPRKAQA